MTRISILTIIISLVAIVLGVAALRADDSKTYLVQPQVVVCDGKDGFTWIDDPHRKNVDVLSIPNDAARRIVATYERVHKAEHLMFLSAYFPNVCTGKERGDLVLLTPAALAYTECYAYLISTQHMMQYLPDLADAIREHATNLGCDLDAADVRRYRDGLKKARRFYHQHGVPPKLDLQADGYVYQALAWTQSDRKPYPGYVIEV